MLISEIPQVVEKNFPMSAGAILTGSQVKNLTLTNFSDVDIVVFNFQISVVSTVNIISDGISFDFTLVPLYDIENVFFNESLHHRGVLLSMIAGGVIIGGSDSLLLISIQEITRKLHGMGHVGKNKLYLERANAIGRLKKEFKKKLTFPERFLLINDFIYKMTQVEISKDANWIISEKHKNGYLKEINSAFIVEMIRFAKKFLLNKIEDDLTPISDYITAYLDNVKIVDQPFDSHNRFVLDIDVKGVAFESLNSLLINEWAHSDKLHERYLYHYESPKQYHRMFLNRLSFVFKTENPLDSKEIFEELKKIFHTRKKNFAVNSNPTNLYSNRNRNSQICLNFENTAVQINKMINNQVDVNQNYDTERNLNIGLILLAYIFKTLNSKIEDIKKTLYYLIQRYFLLQPEQMKIKNMDELLEIKKNTLLLHQLYYSKNEGNIVNMVKKGLHYDSRNPETNKEYAKIIDALSIFLNEQINRCEQLVDDNRLTYNILTNYCQIAEGEKSLLFILTFEQLSQSMFLPFTQKGLSIYLLLSAIGELGKKRNGI